VAVEVGEFLTGQTVFDKLLAIHHHHPVIVAYRPETTVELPMRVLGES